jgi:hypothetical protein
MMKHPRRAHKVIVCALDQKLLPQCSNKIAFDIVTYDQAQLLQRGGGGRKEKRKGSVCRSTDDAIRELNVIKANRKMKSEQSLSRRSFDEMLWKIEVKSHSNNTSHSMGG